MAVGILTGLVLVLTSAVLALVLYFRWSYAYWRRRHVPYLQPEFVYGNFKDAILRRKNLGQTFADIATRLDPHPFGGFFLSLRPALMIRDPELIKSVLVKDFAHFHHRGLKVDEKNDPMSTNLFNLGGVRWRSLRTKLTPTFTSSRMKQMFPLMEACARDFQAALQPFADRCEAVEMKEWNARYTTDVIGSCAFGIHCDSLADPNCQFRAMSRHIFSASFRGIFNFFLVKLGYLFKIKLVSPEVERFYMDVIRQTVDYRRKSNVYRNDFVQLMMEIQDKGGLDDTIAKQLPDDEFVLTDEVFGAQCFAFFVAGFETSSTAMTFCVYELAANQEVQKRLAAEVDDVLRRHGGDLTYAAVQEMSYLDMVLSETLRKYPPAGQLGRVCTLPYTIPGSDVTVEEGIKICIPVYAIHHDQRYYPEPEKFDPQRFSEQQKACRHSFVYLPFGEGPKNCIGMRFGLLQAKVGIAALVSRFAFSPATDTPAVLRFDPGSVVTTPTCGVSLRITARDSPAPLPTP